MLTLREAFNQMETTKQLIEPALWNWYITESNKLTGKKVPSNKKCNRRVKQAHSYLSDYYAQNKKS